jgi:hydrogenase small subunit
MKQISSTIMSRRDLLKYGAKLAAVMGLGSAAVPRIAEALSTLASGATPVLWLQAQSCSGCSVTLLNSQEPGPAQVLMDSISLRFHSNLSAASGGVCMDVINRTIEQGGYLLVVEGSIPAGMPEACVMGAEPVGQQVVRAAKKAKAVVAQGTCAVFGGIPCAEGNPTGSLPASIWLKQQNISTPVISLPGCPPHPDWLVGTLAHVLRFGVPPLDGEGRPKMFYSRLIHDQCPRFADYEREVFAAKFSDSGCLFKLGCMGPNTHADCTQRMWNGGANSCIRAGAPCVGCTSREFAAKTGFAFYRKGEPERRVPAAASQAKR